MWYVKKNRFHITRGDSAYIELGLFLGDGIKSPKLPYELKEGDSIHIQVRETKVTDGDLVFEGKIEPMPDGKIVWHIYPDDTKEMDVTGPFYDPGHPEKHKYWYDAELRNQNGDVFTFIPSSPFHVLDETTKED